MILADRGGIRVSSKYKGRQEVSVTFSLLFRRIKVKCTRGLTLIRPKNGGNSSSFLGFLSHWSALKKQCSELRPLRRPSALPPPLPPSAPHRRRRSAPLSSQPHSLNNHNNNSSNNNKPHSFRHHRALAHSASPLPWARLHNRRNQLRSARLLRCPSEMLN